MLSNSLKIKSAHVSLYYTAYKYDSPILVFHVMTPNWNPITWMWIYLLFFILKILTVLPCFQCKLFLLSYLYNLWTSFLPPAAQLLHYECIVNKHHFLALRYINNGKVQPLQIVNDKTSRFFFIYEPKK